jgi:DNA-binding CsgD family transcriptional regulator
VVGAIVSFIADFVSPPGILSSDQHETSDLHALTGGPISRPDPPGRFSASVTMHGTGSLRPWVAPDHGEVIASFSVAGIGCVVVPYGRNGTGSKDCLGILTIAGQCYGVFPDQVASPPSDPVEVLTPRELEVALLISAGYDMKAVARRLRISFHTVRVHIGRIYAKLGLHKQTELAARMGARFGKL